MSAGLNVQVRIWTINYAAVDNIVGGAITTGTVLGTYPARLQQNPEQQLLLQQGLETERTFNLLLNPGTLAVHERDEIEVIAPIDHVYYGCRFRVRGVTYSSLDTRDPRNYMMISLTRDVSAHARQ